MIEAIQWGMVVPAGVGACCAVIGRRRRDSADWIPSITMVLAMVDVTWGLAGGSPLAAPIVWTLVMLVVAVIPAVRVRLASAHSTREDTAMAVHRSLGLLATAGLIATMAAKPHSIGGHTGMSMPPLLAITGALMIGLVGALTLWLLIHLARRPRRDALAITEVASMATGVLVMAASGM